MTTVIRQRTEDQIRLQARIVQAERVAVIATQLDGEIVYLNPAAEELYGWQSQEVVGRNIVELVVPTNKLESANQIMKALRAGESWTGEFTLKRKDGSQFTAFVTDSPIFDEAGLLIGIVGVSHDLTALKEALLKLETQVEDGSRNLKLANKNLRRLSSRLMQVRDEESRRLARDLHDSAGQLLTAVNMNNAIIKGQFHKLDAAGARAAVENEKLISQISREIRAITYLLHPPLLDEFGLETALRMYVEGYTKRSDIRVDLTVAPDFGRLPEEMEIACFRFIQECLVNVHRHSKSPSAAIKLGYQRRRVYIEVRDEGRGFSLSQLSESRENGVGLAGMRERIRYLDGTLDIKSDANGTVLIARLPLK
jgi:PAS domain S-box-containing protein